MVWPYPKLQSDVWYALDCFHSGESMTEESINRVKLENVDIFLALYYVENIQNMYIKKVQKKLPY